MEQLGYSRTFNEKTLKLIEDIWISLAKYKEKTSLFEDHEKVINHELLFNFLCIIHKYDS